MATASSSSSSSAAAKSRYHIARSPVAEQRLPKVQDEAEDDAKEDVVLFGGCLQATFLANAHTALLSLSLSLSSLAAASAPLLAFSPTCSC